MSNNTPHIPVLLSHVLDVFSTQDGLLVDCTLGYGGHTKALLESNKNLNIIGIDQDQMALDFSTNHLKDYKLRFDFRKGRFSEQIEKLYKENVQINSVLADIGVSSLQLDYQDRGFSFNAKTLDMRMDQNQELSANEVVNTYSKEQLETILKEYGEIRNYRKVAQAIVEARPIYSSLELSQVVSKYAIKSKIHPSTLVFQAIRIEVNDELGELKRLLEVIKNNATKNTLIAIISFHSLEDRIVKQAFKEWSLNCICPPHAIQCTCGKNNSLGKILTKKPLTATQEEIKQNPRSRSAKLRVFRFD